MLLAVLELALALAVPAFAAASNYQFLDSAGNPSSHANSFTSIAIISVSTVTVSYDSSLVTGLKVFNASTSSYDTITGSISGSTISFTFNVSDFSVYLPVKLGVNAGPHSGDIDLQIEWL